MAYGRKRYNKSRKFKPRRKFARKRFNKFRSTKGRSYVKAPVAARETYVKLPWLRTIQTNTSAATASNFAFLGNSLIPYPTRS